LPIAVTGGPTDGLEVLDGVAVADVVADAVANTVDAVVDGAGAGLHPLARTRRSPPAAYRHLRVNTDICR
jgi:hypothetical protein